MNASTTIYINTEHEDDVEIQVEATIDGRGEEASLEDLKAFRDGKEIELTAEQYVDAYDKLWESIYDAQDHYYRED